MKRLRAAPCLTSLRRGLAHNARGDFGADRLLPVVTVVAAWKKCLVADMAGLETVESGFGRAGLAVTRNAAGRQASAKKCALVRLGR